MGLFSSKPAWRHKDAGIRRPAVADLTDADALMEVLRVEEDEEIARIAAARIVNLGRADLLVENLNARRITTIPAIQATLARLESLQKEMETEEQRRRSRTADPAVLVEVIAQTDDLDVALEALARIQNQRALALVLRRTKFARVQDTSREKITDPAVLREIVADSGFNPVERRTALQRIDDPAFHESVALNDGVPHALQLAGLELLRDPVAVGRVAVSTSNGSLRLHALERADDESRATVALTDPDRIRRWAATDPIRDEAILERLAISASDPDVRSTAASRLQNSESLERLATTRQPEVREAVIAKIRDPAVLHRLLGEEKQPGVRAAIEARLGADEILVARTRIGTVEERREAISRLRDRRALEQIARSDSELSGAARERLKRVDEIAVQIAELERRIERLKQLPDYRQDLEMKVSGDSQVFQAYMLTEAGKNSPLAQVERLEAEISSLRRSLE